MTESTSTDSEQLLQQVKNDIAAVNGNEFLALELEVEGREDLMRCIVRYLEVNGCEHTEDKDVTMNWYDLLRVLVDEDLLWAVHNDY